MPLRKKPTSGGARLIAAGKKPVLLGLTAEQHEIVSRAAKEEGVFMTQLLIKLGVSGCKRILEKIISRA